MGKERDEKINILNIILIYINNIIIDESITMNEITIYSDIIRFMIIVNLIKNKGLGGTPATISARITFIH